MLSTQFEFALILSGPLLVRVTYNVDLLDFVFTYHP